MIGVGLQWLVMGFTLKDCILSGKKTLTLMYRMSTLFHYSQKPKIRGSSFLDFYFTSKKKCRVTATQKKESEGCTLKFLLERGCAARWTTNLLKNNCISFKNENICKKEIITWKMYPHLMLRKTFKRFINSVFQYLHTEESSHTTIQS